MRMFGRTSKSFDVSIADFPGEYSEGLAEGQVKVRRRSRKAGAPQSDTMPESENTKTAKSTFTPGAVSGRLYDLEYLSWISQADKFLILVDLADLVRHRMQGAEIRARIFSAVFYLKEASIEDSKRLSDKPLCLVFTKSDIIAAGDQITVETVDSVNFISANQMKYQEEKFQGARETILEQCSETIEMLSNNFSSVSVEFHSSYMKSKYFDDVERRLIGFSTP